MHIEEEISLNMCLVFSQKRISNSLDIVPFSEDSMQRNKRAWREKIYRISSKKKIEKIFFTLYKNAKNSLHFFYAVLSIYEHVVFSFCF